MAYNDPSWTVERYTLGTDLPPWRRTRASAAARVWAGNPCGASGPCQSASSKYRAVAAVRSFIKATVGQPGTGVNQGRTDPNYPARAIWPALGRVLGRPEATVSRRRLIGALRGRIAGARIGNYREGKRPSMYERRRVVLLHNITMVKWLILGFEDMIKQTQAPQAPVLGPG